MSYVDYPYENQLLCEENKQLRAEINEHARLLGISAEKELALRAENERLKAELAAALVACETKDAALSAIIGATKSHVDGRDLLAELHPRHYMDIKVRRDGKDIWFEADWLSNLQRAITSHKAALSIKPDASALKAHDEALIERCAEVCEEYQGSSETCASAIRALKESL